MVALYAKKDPEEAMGILSAWEKPLAKFILSIFGR